MSDAPSIPEDLGDKIPPDAQAAIHALIRSLEHRISALEERLGRDSTNSSKPPSSDPSAVKHVWNSTAQVMLIRGAPGAGKTTMMKPALARLGAPAVLLAPTADASRDSLRKEGFADADTVATFLTDKKRQESVRGGGIIWIDEASLLPIDDLEKVCGLAKSLDARIVLQGDPAQHRAVDRDGNMLRVLEKYAGLPVAEINEIQRQRGDYAQVVKHVRAGRVKKALGLMGKKGWVIEGQGHDALVAEFARAIEEKKPNGDSKTVLVVDPTHKDGDALTERLRALLKDKGVVGQEEKTFERLVPLHWSDAQKSDAKRYSGNETVQFFRKAGRFKPGDRIPARALLPHLAGINPKAFAVFADAQVQFAVGDTLRITSNGYARDRSGQHRVDNGRRDTIKGFTRGGDIVLANGWVLGKDFGHFKHGLVSTSIPTQSKTEDIVLAALNRAALGAINLAQFLVTISRGRERGMVFTDLPREELLEAASREDRRKAAIELFQRQRGASVVERADHRMRRIMGRMQDAWRDFQRRAAEARLRLAQQPQPKKGYSRG